MEVEIEELRRRINDLENRDKSDTGYSGSDAASLDSRFQTSLEFMEISGKRLSDLYIQASTSSAILRALICKSAPESPDMSEVEELSSDLTEQTSLVLGQLKGLISAEKLPTIQSQRRLLSDNLEKVERQVSEIEGVYAEFVGIREMLDKAFVEESNVQYRIANEFQSLRQSVNRISKELLYIREERQKLKLKLRKEYPALPLEELLSVTETPNTAWSELAGNIRLAQIAI